MNSQQIIDLLLEARGYVDEKERDEFLNPKLQRLSDPLRIPDIEKAVARVELALERREKILVYCDYDVDGMTSGALLYRFLHKLGAEVDVFIPERLSEGYGLTKAGLERALRTGKPDLLMALDCGTTSIEEVEFLVNQQIDVVIIDHHELPSHGIPRAQALVNPQRGEEDRSLATVGLVFKFCHALLKLRKDSSLFDLKSHLDLVALGTVADLVPLQDDNRILVKQGLDGMRRTEHIGLQELIRRSGIKRAPTPSTCGFVLGPRLNASGRMADARSGWELLVTENRGTARKIAEDLEKLNRQRQQMEQHVMDEIESWINEHFDPENDLCIVAGSREWHQGVVGIVASRLIRRYYRPAIVVALNEEGHGKGSCRSVEGCSLMDALRDAEHLLDGFGGHAMAAGVELKEERLDDFRSYLNDWLKRNMSKEVFVPQVKIDMELSADELTEELARDLAQLEPFGRSNPTPLFAVRGITVVGEPRVIGGRHIRFKARAASTEFNVIGFGISDAALPSRQPDLAGHWEIDEFTGTPCLRMIDWR